MKRLEPSRCRAVLQDVARLVRRPGLTGKLAIIVGIALAIKALLVVTSATPPSYARTLPRGCAERAHAVLALTLDRIAGEPPVETGWRVVVAEPVAFADTLTAALRGDCHWPEALAGVAAAEADFRAACDSPRRIVPAGGESVHNAMYEASRTCLKRFLRYKLALTRQWPEKEVAGDPQLLEARLYPALFHTEEDLDESTAVAGEALAAWARRQRGRDTLARVAARIALQARYLRWRAVPGQRERRDGVQSAMALLESLSPADALSLEAGLSLVRLEGDAKKLHDEALEVRRKHPSLSVGDYYLAWAAHGAADARTALWHLGQVLALHPADSRANFSLTKLTGDPAPPVFLDALSGYTSLSLFLRATSDAAVSRR